jgi:signal transduction histidine kinase/DNA-binding response OmpR family regulator
MRDIGQRLKAEEKIRRGERMLREAIDAVDEAFVLFDPQDRLVYCNEKYRCLYPGMEHLMVPGTRFEELVRYGTTIGLYKESEGNEEDWIQQRLQAHREGRTVRIQKRVDGQVLRVIDRKTADGHTVGFRVDITEVVRATEVAQEASRYKSQFLANMSHEIRTPMNAILGLLKLMQSTPLNAQQKDYAIKTDTAARSLLGLLNDILDFSKVEAGKMVLDPHPFRLDRLMRDISVVLSSTIGAKPIEVVYDIDPTVPAVLMGDAMRLRQVLINLAGNAIKFTDRGQVIVRLRCVDEVDEVDEVDFGDAVESRIEFSVEDTGIGIDAGDQDRVFDGFSQAEASTTRRFGGTGLGLAICKRLLELMGGELAVQSTLGEGSTFLFTLQLAVVAMPGRDLVERQQVQVPKWRVLVVDDNPIANAAASGMARFWGWQVDCAADAASAMQAVNARLKEPAKVQGPPYDLVVMDWQMPGVDGWEATRALLAACTDAGHVAPRVIILTATGRDTVAQRTPAEQASIHGFLFKPFTAGMLLDAALGPLVETPRPASGSGATSQRRLEGLRILLVEDNLINQQVAQELLRLEGAQVSIAANGFLGVEAVANTRPAFDAVLMDIQMPVLDGYGATNQIRKEWSLHELPIIAMTANAMASDRAACLAAGMNDHIGKPFEMNHLVHVLLRCVGRTTIGADMTSLVKGTLKDDVDSPLLDVDQALQRLSGLDSVYLRIAEEFKKHLETAPHEFRALAQGGSLQPLAIQMHTLKGLAGTLGAAALAAHAARLERLCREAPTGFAPLDHVASFEGLVVATTDAIEVAIQRISRSFADAGQEHDVTVEKPDEESMQHLQLALDEVRKLTEASDLSVLDRFDQLRSAFRVMPKDQFRALESALARLDLLKASAICASAQSSREDAAER